MLLLFNVFRLYITTVKILIILSNFNTNLSLILLNSIYRRFDNIGIFKKNIIIFSVVGSLEFNIILYEVFEKNFFDIYIILGIIIKNKTFHFEVISFIINFFVSNLSYNFNIPLVNFLVITNNKFLFLSKLLKINNLNLKNFYKFINLLYFLKFKF